MVGAKEIMQKKAIMFVAHPDDCLIFGNQYIEHNKEYDWSVIYLTYSETSPRAVEVATYWKQKYNIDSYFLGFNDDPNDLKNKQCSLSQLEVLVRLQPYLINCDLILTHGSSGEYGHPHHIFVHQVCMNIDVEKIYFAHLSSKFNVELCTESPVFDLNAFPKHKDVIIHFNNRANILYKGRYLKDDSLVDQSTLVLLNKFYVNGNLRIFTTNSHWQTRLSEWVYLLGPKDYLFLFDHNNVTHFKPEHWKSVSTFNYPDNIFFFSSSVQAHESRLRAGLNSFLISNNIIVNENNFKIDSLDSKIFDSLYVSRDISEKNIHLSAGIPNLALVIDRWYQSKYFTPANSWCNIHYSYINFTRMGTGDISRLYNLSRTSLSLMQLEGASMGAMESLLCGVPVVVPAMSDFPKNTLGGREIYLNSNNSISTNLNVNDVTIAVDSLISRKLSPLEIRNDALKFILAQRLFVANILDFILKKNGIKSDNGNSLMFENCWNEKRGRHKIAAEGHQMMLSEIKTFFQI
jgi:hypothetical protein